MRSRKHGAQGMRRRGNQKAGILRADMRCLMASRLRQMNAMRSDGAGQCGVVRDQQDQPMFARNGAQGQRMIHPFFGIAGADNHQACRRQGAGGCAGVRQALVISHQGQHTRVEGTRRSC